MKWIISSDHAGVLYKKKIKEYLESQNITVQTAGAENAEEAHDFPDIVDGAMSSYEDGDLIVLICGTGIGASMRANRYKGIRAAVIYNAFVAEAAKVHNNANALCFGSRSQTIEEILSYISIFMRNEYEAGRHVPRLQKLDAPVIKTAKEG